MKEIPNLGEMEPFRVLSSGIPVFDKNSFPNESINSLWDIADDPLVLRMDHLVLQGRGFPLCLKRQNALIFHGDSDGCRWYQTSNGRDVEDILKEVKGEMNIDALGICNLRGYKLPSVNGRSPHTYVRGSNLTIAIRSYTNYGARRLISEWSPSDEGGRIYIRGQPISGD